MRIHICNHCFSLLIGYFVSPFVPRMARSDEICHVRVNFFADFSRNIENITIFVVGVCRP